MEKQAARTKDSIQREMETLKADLGILPPVKKFDPQDNTRLLTGIDPKISEDLNAVTAETQELRRISEALKDPKLKPKALRYMELKRSQERQD